MKVLFSVYTTIAALSFLSLFSFMSSAQIPSGWLSHTAPTAICADEGQRCTFDGDCCHQVCKDHMICEAPLYCVPPRYSCDTNDECCDKAGCNVVKHECNDSANSSELQ